MTDPTYVRDLEPSVAVLKRTPVVLDALLRDLPERWTLCHEGAGTWSACDVVGHLIYCEQADWLPRMRHILEYGDSQPFPPFDRWGHVRVCDGKSLNELLGEFSEIRLDNLDDLRAFDLQDEDLARRGYHPSLGTVTLAHLLATWAAHDLNHLHQIARVMAHQSREDVGPWIRFLGVMQCAGHSAPA